VHPFRFSSKHTRLSSASGQGVFSGAVHNFLAGLVQPEGSLPESPPCELPADALTSNRFTPLWAMLFFKQGAEQMGRNNKVILTGNLGQAARIIDKEEQVFAAFSIATQERYRERKSGEWKNKAPVWHDVLVFKKSLVEQVRAYPKGARIKVTGSLSYQFQAASGNGDSEQGYQVKAARVVADKIEAAPLEKKIV
jgi:hypothetical protein